MNKAPTAVFLAMLATLSLLPAMPLAARAQTPALMTDSALYTGDPGQMFDVTVFMCDVSSLLAYDVTLSYDTNVLSALSADFDTSTLAAGTPHFNVVKEVNDAVGEVRYAMTFTSGYMLDVVGCMPALIVTVKVEQSADSPLAIINDQIVVGPSPVFLDHTTTGGLFQAPPTVQLHRWDASVSPSDRNKFLSRGETTLTLVGTIKMTNQAARGGYAYIVFDIVGPNGELTQATSNVVFVDVGQIENVQATYEFAAVTGRYEIFATLWRGPTADFFVQGESTTGLHFFVHF